MTGEAESGEGRSGLFGSIGMLFGGGRRDDASGDDTGPESTGDSTGDSTGNNAPGPAEAARWTGPAPSADDEDDEEALVLGPSLKAPGDEGASGGSEAPAASDDSEDELTLVADTRNASGEEGDAWAGDASRAEGEEGTADDLPEDGQHQDGQHQDGGGAEELSDEDALVARLRSMGADQWSGFGEPEENHGTPSGDAGAGEADPAEAAPMPQEGHISGVSWLSGEERQDGKGTAPASDAGPEGRETMEAEEMGREDETETDDDALTAGTEAPGAVLFPAAMAAAGKDGREDEPEETGTGAEPDGAEEPREAAESDPANMEAGSEEARDATTDDESGEEEAGPDTPLKAAPATEADDDAAAEAASDSTRSGEDESGSGRDAAEAEVLGILAASSAEPSEGAASEGPEEGAGGDPAGFEESVRRLIREELEGEMGERLSRNIRRMIREEVAHALLRNR